MKRDRANRDAGDAKADAKKEKDAANAAKKNEIPVEALDDLGTSEINVMGDPIEMDVVNLGGDADKDLKKKWARKDSQDAADKKVNHSNDD